jgi:hypothetical protein
VDLLYICIHFTYLIATMTIEEPFEHLGFGGTFARAFHIWLDRFDFFGSIAAIVFVPFFVLFFGLGFLLGLWMIEKENIPEFHPKHIPLAIFVFGLEFMVYELATILGRAVIIRGVAKMYVGQPVTTMECLREAWAKKFPLISVSMIVGFGWTLGITVAALFVYLAFSHPNPLTVFLAVVVAIVVYCVGLYLYIGVVLAYPAIMIENFPGPLRGIKRSWDLATGSRCYLFCVLFCLGFINNLLNRMLHNMFVGGDIMDVMALLVGSMMLFLVCFPLQSM